MTAIIIEHPNAAIGRQRTRRRNRAILRALSNARIVMATQADHTLEVIKAAVEVLYHFGTPADRRIAQQRWDQMQRQAANALSGAV